MTVSHLPFPNRYRVEHPQVVLVVRDLPESCRPCRMVRSGDMTLIAMHQGTPTFEVVKWMTRPGHCTDFELNVIRKAFGQPPVGQPLTANGLDGYAGQHPLPRSLRLISERSLREDTA